ncbi:MAG: hypothetical protein L6Q66_00980 [Bacteroidia bacterium]|nr:hypothetical protein [Bacteroidia bacterium]
MEGEEKSECKISEFDDHIDRLINAEYVKLIEGDIGLCTCQLFRHDTTNAIPFASGVFVHLGDNFYLLTASHVIEDWSDSNKLFVALGDGFVSIVGKGCGTEIDKNEKIDAAYVKLKPELVPYLSRYYRFLPYENILHQEKILHEPNYCAFGYPVINKRKDGESTFGSAYFMRGSYDKVYEHYSLNPLSHYSLEFLGKAVNIKTNKTEKIRTEHYGMSGGGLWYIDIGFDEDKEELVSHAKLIGIMTEFRRSKYDCLIANRIEIVLASIKSNEDEKFES